MSNVVMTRVMRIKLERSLKMVLMFLAERCNDEAEDAYPSIKRLAAECDMDRRTIQRTLRELEGRKLIELQYEPGTVIAGKPRPSATYRLLMDNMPPVAWLAYWERKAGGRRGAAPEASTDDRVPEIEHSPAIAESSAPTAEEDGGRHHAAPVAGEAAPVRQGGGTTRHEGGGTSAALTVPVESTKNQSAPSAPTVETVAPSGVGIREEAALKWLRETVKARFGWNITQNWFGKLTVVEIAPDRLVVRSPNQFSADTITGRYLSEIEKMSGRTIFVIGPNAPIPGRHVESPSSSTESAPSAA